ncbi:methyltransferase domain-containing protein [Candidatus Thorarchaeota archaeon]|nr:MAG: methyltransferase domain-containing protein [Candidatus Thorarchaeota archaeon]
MIWQSSVKMNKRSYAVPFPFLHAVSLLSHKRRIEKFRTVIHQVVDNGSVVVDLGCGSGVLGMLAAKAGAKKVTCVDINPEAIEYARRTARKNNLEDRMDFIAGDFRDMMLGDRADVVICEMLSSFMLVEQQIPASVHARKHLLKSDGILLPSRVRIYLVPVECEGVWSRFSQSGIEFEPVPQTVEKGMARDLADLALVSELTFNTENEPKTIDESLDFNVCSDGNLHGFVGMFEADLGQKIKLRMEDGWRELFMPIESPLCVKEGQTLRVHVRFTPGEYDTLRLHVQLSAQ